MRRCVLLPRLDEDSAHAVAGERIDGAIRRRLHRAVVRMRLRDIVLAILVGLLAAVVLVVAVSARRVAPARISLPAPAAVEPTYPQAVKSDRLIREIPLIELPAPAPKPVVTERIIEAPPPDDPPKSTNKALDLLEHDSICGTKGRTWYTRDNGRRYWRCNR